MADKNMHDDNTRIWRSLSQLAQATYAVLEREIPEYEGLPVDGLPVVRLLRWHGPKTIDAVAVFLGVSSDRARETVDTMLAVGIVQYAARPHDEQHDTIQLAPTGILVSRRIIEAQRERVQLALERVPGDLRALAADVLEKLAFGLVTDSTGFGITCAACWAFDSRECINANISAQCAFLQAKRANLDPDLAEDPDECPRFCPAAKSQLIEIKPETQ